MTWLVLLVNITAATPYADADQAGRLSTHRSIIGWCIFLGDSLISWKYKKQDWLSEIINEGRIPCNVFSLLRNHLNHQTPSRNWYQSSQSYSSLYQQYYCDSIARNLIYMSTLNVLRSGVILSEKSYKTRFHHFLVSHPHVSLQIQLKRL